MTTAEQIKRGRLYSDRVTADTVDNESYYNLCQITDLTGCNAFGLVKDCGKTVDVIRDRRGNTLAAHVRGMTTLQARGSGVWTEDGQEYTPAVALARTTEHLEWILRHPDSAQREERGCNGDASLLLDYIAADICNLCGIQAD